MQPETPAGRHSPSRPMIRSMTIEATILVVLGCMRCRRAALSVAGDAAGMTELGPRSRRSPGGWRPGRQA
ncbi:MAG: hypothetical protein WKF75_14395 [Singulisphaera sp.]